MAHPNFRLHHDYTHAMQAATGLRPPDCSPPRDGDRTMTGQQGPDIVCSQAHMHPLDRDQARALFDAIPGNLKNNPNNPILATAISKIAIQAGQGTPNGCSRMIGRPKADNVTFYCSAGSAIFTSKTDGAKFGAFLYNNQDQGHRVLWLDMTGRQQYEWFDAWVGCGKTWVRNAPMTRGLVGTDVAVRIPTQNDLRTAALMISPTVVRRRPPNHPTLTQNDFDTVRVQLGLS